MAIWGCLKAESVFCRTAPWDCFGDKFKLSFLRNLVITNEWTDSRPKTIPQCNLTQHRPSLNHRFAGKVSINTQDQEASRPSRFLLVLLACGVTCNSALVKTRYLQLENRKVAKTYQISILIFTFDFFSKLVFKKNWIGEVVLKWTKFRFKILVSEVTITCLV